MPTPWMNPWMQRRVHRNRPHNGCLADVSKQHILRGNFHAAICIGSPCLTWKNRLMRGKFFRSHVFITLFFQQSQVWRKSFRRYDKHFRRHIPTFCTPNGSVNLQGLQTLLDQAEKGFTSWRLQFLQAERRTQESSWLFGPGSQWCTLSLLEKVCRYSVTFLIVLWSEATRVHNQLP